MSRNQMQQDYNQQHNEITLVVRYTPLNKFYNISLDKNVTIKELEMQFRELLDIGPDKIIKFQLGGQTLQREKTLLESNVVKGSNLDLLIDYKGG